MTLPLILLAIPSIAPGHRPSAAAASGRHGMLAGWLEPVFEESEEYLHGTPRARSQLFGIDGVADPDQRRRRHRSASSSASTCSASSERRGQAGRRSTRSSTANGATRFLYRASLNKWWFDELNDLLFIRIGGRVAAFLWWFDRTIVDGTVNGVGTRRPGTRAAACGGSRPGRVQNYALGIAIGLIVMAGSFLLIVGQPR